MTKRCWSNTFANSSNRTSNTVNIAWQGGEPTLMGLDFYKRAMKLAEKYRDQA